LVVGLGVASISVVGANVDSSVGANEVYVNGLEVGPYVGESVLE